MTDTAPDADHILIRKIKSGSPRQSLVGLFEVLAVYDKVCEPRLQWMSIAHQGMFHFSDLTPLEEERAKSLLDQNRIMREKGARFCDAVTARKIIPA